MKNLVFGIFLILISASSFAQRTVIEEEIKELSLQKWQWAADKDMEKLANLFHDKSKFVHMSGT